MRLPKNLDPMRVSQLMRDIDKQCLRLLTDDFLSTIDATALNKIKEQVRTEISSLLTEMLSDWQQLKGRADRKDVFPGTDVIPGVEMMEQLLPGILQPPTVDSESEADKEPIIAWHAKRLSWIVSIWLKVQLRLLNDVNRLSHSQDPVPSSDAPDGIVAPFPAWNITALYSEWHLLRHTTFEYFQIKSNLLASLGEETPMVNISQDDVPFIGAAAEAIDQNEHYGALLLEQAVRGTLMNIMGLKRRDLKFDLRGMPTSTLIAIASRAGVRFKFRLATLGNIVMDLENFNARCERPPLYFLMPAREILLSECAELEEYSVTAEVERRLTRILDSIEEVGE